MTEQPYAMLGLIRSDVEAKAEWLYGDVTRMTVLKAYLTDGTCAMLLYRLMQWCQRHHLKPLAMVFNKLNVLFSRCVIGRDATFGPRFVLIHSLGVVINSDVVGGSDVKLEHGVTIGAEKGKAPRLGNNIFVGAGAKILGDISIGDNVKIGANAVVLSDIPSNCTAVGIPAKPVHEAASEE